MKNKTHSETLSKIKRTLKAIEFHLSELCEVKTKYPENEFWDLYLEYRLLLYLDFEIRIDENRYMRWHKVNHGDNKISVKTLYQYAKLKKESYDKALSLPTS